MTEDLKVASPHLSIAGRQVGDGAPAFLIAEIAQAHDGSLGLAHAYVDAAAEAGADAVKFQTHIAAAESTLDEQFRVKFSKQDDSRYAYWKRMEFTPSQWRELARHADDLDLIFISSAFSIAAVELLADIGMPAWKIASGELGSANMLDAMIATGAPLLVSSGMSTWSDIDALVATLVERDRDHAVLQCTSRYPTALADVGLNVIDEMRGRYSCPVGLSDHSGTVFPALAGIARGTDVIEAHLTLDRRMFGPDVQASLTVSEFRHVSDVRDAFHEMATNPVNKDALARELLPMRDMFQRSIALRESQPAGTVLSTGMLTAKKPGTGIPETETEKLVGRILARDISSDRLLRWEDLS